MSAPSGQGRPRAPGMRFLYWRLRAAGLLLMIALGVMAVSLLWSHPAAFLLFIFGGGPLLAAGVLFYFYSLLAHAETPPGE